MFCGELAEQEQINLPDCDMKVCSSFALPVYRKVYLSDMNVMQVLYLAEKYIVALLTKRCNNFLNLNLDTSNVFSVIKHANFFSNDDLASDCWYFVDKNAKDVLASAKFRAIERSVLQKVVAREMVDCWAVKECKRQNLEAEGPVKRLILK